MQDVELLGNSAHVINPYSRLQSGQQPAYVAPRRNLSQSATAPQLHISVPPTEQTIRANLAREKEHQRLRKLLDTSLAHITGVDPSTTVNRDKEDSASITATAEIKPALPPPVPPKARAPAAPGMRTGLEPSALMTAKLFGLIPKPGAGPSPLALSVAADSRYDSRLSRVHTQIETMLSIYRRNPNLRRQLEERVIDTKRKRVIAIHSRSSVAIKGIEPPPLEVRIEAARRKRLGIETQKQQRWQASVKKKMGESVSMPQLGPIVPMLDLTEIMVQQNQANRSNSLSPLSPTAAVAAMASPSSATAATGLTSRSTQSSMSPVSAVRMQSLASTSARAPSYDPPASLATADILSFGSTAAEDEETSCF